MTDVYTTGQPPMPAPAPDMQPTPTPSQPVQPPQQAADYGTASISPYTPADSHQYQTPPTPQYQQTAPQYGYAPQQPPYQPYNQQRQADLLPWSGLGIAGFVCSVVSLFFLGIILGPLGIILSILGYRQTSQGTHRGRGLALAGIIIGGICTALAVIGIIVGFSAIATLL